MTDPLASLSPDERDKLEPAALPAWVDPMLATLVHDHFSSAEWIYERKLDGQRALAFAGDGTTRLMTRNRNELSATYPELVDALSGRDRSFVVDGEVVAFDGKVTSFSRLQKRMQIKDAEKARATEVPVYYYVFDIMHWDGHDLTALPLRSRKALLKRALAFDDPVRYATHRNADGEAFLKEACGKGWEGLIAKRAASAYLSKRSRDWLKFKCGAGQELVIGGYTEPKGERHGFGALLVGYFDDGDLRYAGKVGTGFDDAFLKDFAKRLSRASRATSPFADDVSEEGVTWVTPKFVGEFGFTEWTSSGKLRHPRFLGLRDDKPAEKVIREDRRQT